jgi:bifunctional UDP-N-acetylglucosamine pyrophosphorylase / glucosamine-1-phosphate N-acetyltransferase
MKPLINAVILAAGKGTRMKSNLLKVLHKIAGKPVISYVIDTVKKCNATPYVVVGHQKDLLIKTLASKDITFITQEKQLGTGHAVAQVIPQLNSKEDSITLILAGDCPLISEQTILSLIAHHSTQNLAATILTTNMQDPTGYGRLIRHSNGTVLSIKEHKDCSKQEKKITEINSGVYAFNTSLLTKYINEISTNNAQAEYYLTDIIEILKKKKHKVDAKCIENSNEVIGINTRLDLANTNSIKYLENAHYHMKNGVTIIDPKSTFIDSNISIKEDTIIYPFCIIKGNTKIGKNCIIHAFCEINNTNIKDNETIESHNKKTKQN